MNNKAKRASGRRTQSAQTASAREKLGRDEGLVARMRTKCPPEERQREAWRRQKQRQRARQKKKSETIRDAPVRERMLRSVRNRRMRAKRRQRKSERGTEIRTYEELIEALRSRRHELGLTQQDLNEIAGFQDGYVNKLEIGYREGGRGIGAFSLPTWLDALGVRLLVVPR